MSVQIPGTGQRVYVPARRKRVDPALIVLRRLKQGLYFVAGTGITAVIAASFAGVFTFAALVGACATSLLCGAVGIILEIVESGENANE